MSLLVAINGWHEPDWIERFQRLLPDRKIISAKSDFDPAAIDYVTAGSIGRAPSPRCRT